MEVDSTHSLIERSLKNTLIYVPMDYVNVFKKARQNPSPFDVRLLDHSFFLDFSKIGVYKSIRPGRSKGDPIVSNIRGLRYTPDINIQYKLNYEDEWASLPTPRGQNSSAPEAPTPLYSDSLKIQQSKYKHLQELKSVIPKDHHSFYDNLRH